MEKGTTVKLMQEFNVHLYKIKENEKVLEKKRIAFVTDYNAINIKCLTKESYCTGLEKTTFCYRIENELRELGDMHGTNASKFGLYYGKWGEDEICKMLLEEAGYNYNDVMHEIQRLNK